MPTETFSRRLVAEFIGTMFLVSTVVGSGIMAERLAEGNAAIALLANTIATGAGLFVLIVMFARISGSHFNPVVSISSAVLGELSLKGCASYVLTQTAGAITGTAIANLMFGLFPIVQATKVRSGSNLWFAEVIATFGLVAVVISVSRQFEARVTAVAVAAYISAAYWFTSSTSFANPAVTIARALTDTFTGIRPIDVPPFVAAQLSGGLIATFLFTWLVPKKDER